MVSLVAVWRMQATDWFRQTAAWRNLLSGAQ